MKGQEGAKGTPERLPLPAVIICAGAWLGLEIRNLSGYYWRLVWGFEWDSRGLAIIQGRGQMMGACIAEGLRVRETERERADREKGRENRGGRERGGEAMSKVPLGFLQNSTVLMLRDSESDRAVFLDKRHL